MTKYPAKKAYQDLHSAEQYDKIRFTSLRGKYLDKLERESLLACLSKAFDGISPETIHILDIPCGTGRITETLLNAGYQTSGSDISEEMMAVAEKRLTMFPGLKGFHKEDISHLTFNDSVFDASSCVRLMGHLPPEIKESALKELARVSKNFLIVTFYISNIKNDFKRLIMNKVLHKTAPWYPSKRHEIAALANKCGLKIMTYFDVHRLISEASTYLFQVQK